MIAGTIVLEDHLIHFTSDSDSGKTTYTVLDVVTGDEEEVIVDSLDFSNAIAIALHKDALEQVVTAEMQASAEAGLGDIRWIP